MFNGAHRLSQCGDGHSPRSRSLHPLQAPFSLGQYSLGRPRRQALSPSRPGLCRSPSRSRVRFDASHGTRLATYATWWIRQTLQIAVARQSHLVSLSPHHLQELGLLQQESEALAHGGKHLPSPQELASRTGSSLEHLTHLQTATRAPVSLNAVLDDDSDFKLTEAMPDNESQTLRTNSERQEALSFLMENLRPRERKVLDLRFGLTGNGTHSLRQIGHLLRISKERVRQIQNRALEKLRASAERVGWEPSLLLG